ncbi:hypothetical protein BBK14_09125 [Parafrankia soli]|uniref:DUF222 domain-containing protein n=1 Tax=Parafrankia soli TaxID=2599596 RepID=A0A1S1PEB7_9ACTN|nr:DUF222 domain-containing protein [Parafrankia soli]OHV19656.1 hypothetical protein BBK14_09125 [Parafrankia soli]
MLFACTVAHRLPHAVEALKSGVLDVQRLRSLENAVRPLDDPLAAQVEARVLAGGARPTRGAFTDACRRAVHRLDPAGAAERARARKKERRVWVLPGEDGTSCLSAVLPAAEATACYRRVDQIAQGIAAHRGGGDTRSRDQIRADVLVDLLCGRTEHAVPLPCEVQVVVPVTVLLGLAEDPGEIPGYGPIPAVVAREMAARPGSTWRRILTDPQGTLVEIADRRLPTAAQARHVRARNRTCVFPGCARTSRRSSLTHIHTSNRNTRLAPREGVVMNRRATPSRGGKYPTTHSHHSDPHHTRTQAPEFQHRARCALECPLWILATCTACDPVSAAQTGLSRTRTVAPAACRQLGQLRADSAQMPRTPAAGTSRPCAMTDAACFSRWTLMLTA